MPLDATAIDAPNSISAAVGARFALQLFHVADQEAGVAAVDDIPRFSAVLNALRAQEIGVDGSLFLSSGDAYIPGLFLDASKQLYGAAGVADMIVQNLLGVDAISFGNHEFDKGTALVRTLITGEGIAGYDGAKFPYLSGNLDFSTDANLKDLVVADGGAPQAGVITGSVVITPKGTTEKIGIVSATTPTLASISSPGDVTIEDPFTGNPTEADLDRLAANIQKDVDALLAANPDMNKVVLMAHMQQIDIETKLAARLKGVDIIIAGGSNTRLTDENDALRDDDVSQGGYPRFLKDADDHDVALVNTDANYKYLGRLVIEFDENGHIDPSSYDPDVSGAYKTDDEGVKAVGGEGMTDPEIQKVVDAIRDQIIANDANFFGKTDVFLNGVRSGGPLDGVRTQETNLGDLTADANLWNAKQSDSEVVISIKNGGGIRASIGEITTPAGAVEPIRIAPTGNELSGRPEGGISQNAINNALAFNNGLTLLSLTTEELAAVLEHGVSGLPGVAGRFPQISGLKFSFDPDAAVGDRIQNAGVFAEDGSLIAKLVENGEIVDNGAQTFRIVTLSFLASPRFDADGKFIGAGDGYPFPNTNTDPSKGELGDAAVIARANVKALAQADDAPRTGAATFAEDGSEQDALAEYLAAKFSETAFDMEDTDRAGDMRIQNLNFRADAVFADTAKPTVINAVLGSTTGTDGEYIELFGEAGASLAGLSLIVIESDAGGSNGQIDRRFDFDDDDALGDNGFFLLANGLAQSDYNVTADAQLSNNFIENSSYTIALVKTDSITGGKVTGAEQVVDSLGVTDGGANDSFALGAPVFGPDGRFLPAGARRVEDGVDTDSATDWKKLDFNKDVAINTPTSGGTAGNGGDTVTIMEIQGKGLTSAMEGDAVKTSGVVTALRSNGFYMQDPKGDGDAATSDGIFVFTGGAPGVTVGDAVEVAATVSEFTPGGARTGNLSTTQLTSPNVTVVSSGNDMPTAVTIGGDNLPPTDSIANGIAFFEALEGMLVTAETPTAVSSSSRFGEVFTLVNGADQSGLSQRGALVISEGDFNPERVQLQFGAIEGGAGAIKANVGATFQDVTGVIDYSFGNYEIRVTDATVTYQDNALPKPVTAIESAEDEMTVASYNVLNLDPNDADGDTDVADGRFEAIAKQIVENLKSPDVLSLQEVQDNSGSANDGTVSASETLQNLADAIKAAGGPAYEVIDNSFIGNNTSGGQPGGNIRTAFLYNPERVKLVEGSVQTISGQGEGEAFNGARLPLVAKFAFNGEEVTVVNNHFSSKGGSKAIMGTEQPFEDKQEDKNVNGSLDERQAQAAAVKAFVDGLFAKDPKAHVAVMGDFNEFQFVSPVKSLAEKLQNLIESLPPEERYTYSFQGNSQALDHMLVSGKLAEGAKFEVIHINAEYAETPQRASDHDPLIAKFKLGPALLAGTAATEIIAGTDAAEIIDGKGGNDAVSGGGAADVFRFTSTDNGARERVLITDYDAAEGDVIDLQGATVLASRARGGDLSLLVGEDRDIITLKGVSDLDQIVFSDDALLIA